ncbi:hypothetical protein HSBAA_42250 [Vreelandella sulfidaeris]|uniref:FAD-binding oxidoreductase/transferase type 4 C-terminal domain-containing protein n=1 Tax=Vreelandella sulfidaeris TaxID=115553 RepID=A0A455UF72_9GAMM|nr:hypothetical protein HSBAA_42250 [Halomonas sulfidaeris]
MLNVLPIPKHATLVNVRYTSFMDALRDAKALMASSARPTSIETVDDTVLKLAMEDFVWDSVAALLPRSREYPIGGINLIEFNDDDEATLAERVKAFTDHLSQDASVERLGYTLAEGRGQIQKSMPCVNARLACLATCKARSAPRHSWKTPQCRRNIWQISSPSSALPWTPAGSPTECLGT